MINSKLKKSIIYLISFLMISIAFFCNSNDQTLSADLGEIKLPPGFKIDVYADNVDNARSMTLGDNETLFVGTRESEVYAVIDENKDFKADKVLTIASGLNSPNGVTFRNGSLYVAEINRVLRYDNIEANLDNPPAPVVVNDKFPDDTHHGWKYIGFGPDGMLYIPVGAPCNICLRDDDERYASLMRMNADGTDLEVFAKGIRNTVGFDWNPETKELWFTDNGRDMLGDDIPPDELNRAPGKGLNFGYPFVHGDDIRDPEFGESADVNKYVKPMQKLGPHAAALGMKFYTGNMFPDEYKNQIFIAEHGSWNRSSKIGYRIMLVRLKGNKAVSYEPFAEGWLQGDSVSGRPVDILLMPDGSLLVSDDYAGLIYRITYSK
jgi:glucose/arabinose dehydrogenase